MSKEYADNLKNDIKEYVDKIDTSSSLGQKVIKLIYGFVKSGFKECVAGKGGDC